MPQETHLHTLWQNITYELVDIFDAHGVCAAVASEVAVFTQTKTVVGVSGSQGRYFDVWICQSDGRITQTRWQKEKSSFAPLIAAKQATIFEKFALPAADLIHSELWQLPKETILSVPLPMPGRYTPVTPPGVLCLIDPGEDNQLDLAALEALATNVTIFLDRAYLRRLVDRQDVEFSVVTDISNALTSTLSLKKIFNQLLDPVRRTLNVESVSVGLIEEPNQDILFVDMLLGPLFENLPPLRLKKGQGIAGWVAEHREPVIINDVYTDERFYKLSDRRSGFRTNSMLCIPLQVEDRVIGILQAINKQDSNFTENDLRLLQAIGAPLAAAIENASLHNAVISEKRRIETIFANMSEGLMTVNAKGLITNANDALLSLLHQESLSNLIGKTATEVVRLTTGSLDTLFDKGEEHPQLATDVYQPDGDQVPVLISGAMVRDSEGPVSEMIFVFSDLRQIREVERMRDDFFHGIIHELRTPLATILMYARLLREGKAQDAVRADRFLGVIERESDRLQKMVRQMLQVVKMEARELQRSAELVHLNAVFDEMLPPQADRATEKGLTFIQRVASELPPVIGNQEMIYLIFKNLVDNAIKFTLSGKVRVDAWLEDDFIFVRIEDDGIGIPKQAMPNLFGRFFRAQTAVERGIAGTGLGLYMVREAIENYRGTIDVTSAPGKGTSFTVRLPVAKDES